MLLNQKAHAMLLNQEHHDARHRAPSHPAPPHPPHPTPPHPPPAAQPTRHLREPPDQHQHPPEPKRQHRRPAQPSQPSAGWRRPSLRCRGQSSPRRAAPSPRVVPALVPPPCLLRKQKIACSIVSPRKPGSAWQRADDPVSSTVCVCVCVRACVCVCVHVRIQRERGYHGCTDQ